jgi:DNA-directed RNA polymerase
LLRTVNAAVREDIRSIATIHDSFGCLPSRAERFRQIIREQFVRMYADNDVLAQVLQPGPSAARNPESITTAD